MKLEAIKDYEIEDARKVLKDHMPKHLTRESALESLLWCIANQSTNWERPVNFVYNMRSEAAKSHPNGMYTSWDFMMDKQLVNKIAQDSGLMFYRESRYDYAIDYFRNKKGKWWEEIVNADIQTRKKYVNEIKYLGMKTFSFWHICLGGKNLIALDIWIRRQLQSDFGIKDLEKYSKPTIRYRKKKEVSSNGFHQLDLGLEIIDGGTAPTSYEHPLGRRIMPGLPEKVYLNVEKKTKEIFKKDQRFILPNGQIDLALVDALLWWRGAHRYGEQSHFLGNGMATFVMPYAMPFN